MTDGQEKGKRRRGGCSALDVCGPQVLLPEPAGQCPPPSRLGGCLGGERRRRQAPRLVPVRNPGLLPLSRFVLEALLEARVSGDEAEAAEGTSSPGPRGAGQTRRRRGRELVPTPSSAPTRTRPRHEERWFLSRGCPHFLGGPQLVRDLDLNCLLGPRRPPAPHPGARGTEQQGWVGKAQRRGAGQEAASPLGPHTVPLRGQPQPWRRRTGGPAEKSRAQRRGRGLRARRGRSSRA